jgi:hypothetical protein
MNFKSLVENELVNEARHNDYVDFEIKVLDGPFPGRDYGYKDDVEVYKVTIVGDNDYLMYQPRPDGDWIGTKVYQTFWYGPGAKFKEQAKAAIMKYNLNKKDVTEFNDLLDVI